MKAIVWTKAGAPDVLQLQEIAQPVPKEDELLIRIAAATVTAADCKLRGSNTPRILRLLGLMRPGPLVLGQELAGEVEAAGSKVTRFKVGDQVVAWSAFRLGAYAEYTCLPEKGVLALKPVTISFEEAATLPVGGLDALYFLKKAHIRSGQRVLINGAGGSIGSFAVQLAKYYGAEVTGVDSTDKLDMLRAVGADQVIDYTQEDFSRNGQTYDVIFDVIGKSSFSRAMKMLAKDGRYLLANPQTAQLLRGLWLSRTSSKQVIAWSRRSAAEYAADFAVLIELIEAGKIRPVIDKCYPLEETAAAHRYVETGLKKGNVVITLGSGP